MTLATPIAWEAAQKCNDRVGSNRRKERLTAALMVTDILAINPLPTTKGPRSPIVVHDHGLQIVRVQVSSNAVLGLHRRSLVKWAVRAGYR
jgi:hypothetical protein